MTDDAQAAPPPGEDDEGRIGIFPSWNALYVTVVIYAFVIIAALTYMTVRLDFS